MRANKENTLAFTCLLSIQLMSAAKQEQSIKMIKSTYVLSEEEQKHDLELAEKVITTISDFDDKYNNHPRLLCTTCKKETFTHGSVLGFIFLCSTNPYWAPDKMNIAKKLMAEALDIFPHKKLDKLTEFMARAANELQLNCYDYKCSGTQWETIKYT